MSKELAVVIESTQGKWKTVFPETTKVLEVIEATKKHFGFSEKGNYQLKLENGEVMRPERTLESYHLKEDVHLTFVDLGSAA